MTTQIKKVSVAGSLGIKISPTKISSFFTYLGVNKAAEEEFTKVYNKIHEIKKIGIEKPPQFKAICPKQLSKEHQQDEILMERYKKDREAYQQARDARDAVEKKYEQYSSPEYRKALLAHRLKRKLEELTVLAEPAKNQEKQPARTESLNALKKSICEYKHEKWGMTFDDIYPEASSLLEAEEWKTNVSVMLSSLNNTFKDTNALFAEKDAIEAKKTRFGEAVRFASAFIAQETLKDILEKAIAACARDCRSTLKREDFAESNINKSQFFNLYGDLAATRALDAFISRKKLYEETKKELDRATKDKKIRGTFVKTFEETEVSCGFAKDIKGKKMWPEMNISENDISLVTYVCKIFDIAKNETKKNFHISQHAKEYVSILLKQFLEKLNKQIIIILKRNEKKVQKTFDVNSLFMLIQLQLVTADPKVVNELFDSAKKLLEDLKEKRKKEPASEK